jgi:uncharacterized membrane protein YfcA
LHLWLGIFLIGAMGLILGLLGGGGSILTVPILVYVLGMEAHSAIVVSLVLVGGTALVGALLHQQHCELAWKQGLLFVAFGAPLNFVGAQLSGRVPAVILLAFFGVLMVVSGVAVLAKRTDPKNFTGERSIWPAVAAGAAVGFLAGFLGIGGGFMIVPSLVLFLQMPIKTATGTSLLVITANSGVALFGHRHGLNPSGLLLLELVPAALIATYIGVWLAQKLSAHQLREIFGYFVILLGVLMAAYNGVILYRR